MVGVRSLWRQNGREGKSREWLLGIICVCVWCLWWCKCLCVGVYDVAAGAERQNSGRPDSKRVAADREGEREAVSRVKRR